MALWGSPFNFDMLSGGIGSVSYGMMWCGRWSICIGAHPGWKDMLPCGSTLGSGAGGASGVDSGLFTLVVGMGGFFWCGIAFVGVGTCGEAAMLKISVS